MTWPLEFPTHLLRMSQYSPARLIGAKVSGGRSLSNITQSTRIDGGGAWVVSMAATIYDDVDDIRAIEALRAYLAEGLRPIRVPLFGSARAPTQPWPIINGETVTYYAPLSFSDGSFFSDGSGWGQDVILASLADSAALRATSITLAKEVCGDIRGGEIFSIRHTEYDDRAYRITFVTDQDDDTAVVTIEPPLREATDAGVKSNFDAPMCVMELAEDEGSQSALAINPPYLASAGFSFIESFKALS